MFLCLKKYEREGRKESLKEKKSISEVGEARRSWI